MKEYWIINIGKIILSIGDLNITLRPMQKINLLDEKLGLNKYDIKYSLLQGDLKKKKDKLLITFKRPNLAPIPEIIYAECGEKRVDLHYDEIKEDNLIMENYSNISDEKFIDELLDSEDESIKK